ncbi:MAG: hypothetical protein KDK76_07850 [Chlamydiia bacterium]|nr:hypothetical protein [Chlamydiia bacterium]
MRLFLDQLFTSPNQLRNEDEGEPGHLTTRKFALLQARQSFLFNGFGLVMTHAGFAFASKMLKGRFFYPLSIGALQGVISAIAYTFLLDGRSAIMGKDLRSLDTWGFGPNKQFSTVMTVLFAPIATKMISTYVIKNPVSLKVAAGTSGISWLAVVLIDRKKLPRGGYEPRN